MTKFDRVWNVGIGVLMVILGVALFTMDVQPALLIATLVVLVRLSTSCLRSLGYYARMARHMVGGRRELYRGVIYADLAIVLGALANVSLNYIILYIAAMYVYSGAVDILKSRESKAVGAGSWKFTAAHGAAEILIAIAIVTAWLAFGKPDAAVYVYSAGIVYSGAVRIASSFKRTAIVYIQ